MKNLARSSRNTGSASSIPDRVLQLTRSQRHSDSRDAGLQMGVAHFTSSSLTSSEDEVSLIKSLGIHAGAVPPFRR